MRKNNWTADPGAVKTFSRFCAPTALAALLKITTTEAANRLLSEDGLVARNDIGAVLTLGWSSYLERLGARIETAEHVNTDEEKARHERQMDDWYEGRRQTRPVLKRGGTPTVARWLKQHPDLRAILQTHGHTLYVENGKVVGDTLESRSMRRQVYSAAIFG